MNYQPIVDATAGVVVGFEALLRWDRAGHGRVPPDRFIPIAEESGLVLELDHWVLGAVLAQASTWFADPAFDGTSVSVNVSGRSLLDPALRGPRQHRARGVRHRPAADHARGHRDLHRHRHGAGGGAAGGHPPAGHPDRDRRLRHRLHEHRPPARAARRHDQDRQQLRPPAPAGRQPRVRPDDQPAGPPAAHPDGGRGRRDARAAREPPVGRLRPPAGLPVLAPARRRRRVGLDRRDVRLVPARRAVVADWGDARRTVGYRAPWHSRRSPAATSGSPHAPTCSTSRRSRCASAMRSTPPAASSPWSRSTPTTCSTAPTARSVCSTCSRGGGS